MSGRNVSNPHVQTFYVIERYFAEHKHAPTIEELAESVGVTTSTINRHLLMLETEDLIRRANYASRGIELTGVNVNEVVRVNLHEINHPSRKPCKKQMNAYSLNFPVMPKMSDAELEKRIKRIVRRDRRNQQAVPGEDAVQIAKGPLFRNDRLRATKIG